MSFSQTKYKTNMCDLSRILYVPSTIFQLNRDKIYINFSAIRYRLWSKPVLAAITMGVNVSLLHLLKTIKSCQDIMCAINWSEQMAYEFNTNYKQLSHSMLECLQ